MSVTPCQSTAPLDFWVPQQPLLSYCSPASCHALIKRIPSTPEALHGHLWAHSMAQWIQGFGGTKAKSLPLSTHLVLRTHNA